MGDEEVGPYPEFDAIVVGTGLDFDQVESLKKGFDGFDKEGGGRY